MATLYLDTHAAAWIAGGLLAGFSSRGRAALRSSQLLLSPMVILELQYLHETGRLASPGREVAEHLQRGLGLVICSRAFDDVVRAGEAQRWTRDPFDRLIVAQAALSDAPLLSRDRLIQANYIHAFWD